MNPYETRKLVDEYLLFHYGTAEETLPWPGGLEDALGFAVRSVDLLVDWAALGSGPLRALDIGCAVGRSSFELSRRCREVVGIDFSEAFVNAARTLGRQGGLAYDRREEGRLSTPLEARLPAGTNPENVRFEVGDAMDLRDGLGPCDLLHAANLICRLPRPRVFLERAHRLVRPDGQLVLTTPGTWLEEFTPRESWPEGETLDFLQAELGDSFELEKTEDLPFLIRETRRKYQWTVAQGTRWRKRGGTDA